MPTFLLLCTPNRHDGNNIEADEPIPLVRASRPLHACALLLAHMRKLPDDAICDSRYDTIWSELHRWCIYAHHQALAEAAGTDLDKWMSRQRDLRVNLHKLLPRDLLRAITLSSADLTLAQAEEVKMP
jgi:hypothetical protein